MGRDPEAEEGIELSGENHQSAAPPLGSPCRSAVRTALLFALGNVSAYGKGGVGLGDLSGGREAKGPRR